MPNGADDPAAASGTWLPFGFAAAKDQHRRANRDERGEGSCVGQRGDRGQRDQAREHRGDNRGEDGDPHRRPRFDPRAGCWQKRVAGNREEDPALAVEEGQDNGRQAR